MYCPTKQDKRNRGVYQKSNPSTMLVVAKHVLENRFKKCVPVTVLVLHKDYQCPLY